VTNNPAPGDYEYIAPIQFGTPPQTLGINIDTGSADL